MALKKYIPTEKIFELTYKYLRYLKHVEDKECSLSEIARKVGVSLPAACRMMEKLEELNFVCKKPGESESEKKRKAVYKYSLTENERKILRIIKDSHLKSGNL